MMSFDSWLTEQNLGFESLKDAAQGKFTGAAVQEKKFNFHFCIP
jgi:hypothetical protein